MAPPPLLLSVTPQPHAEPCSPDTCPESPPGRLKSASPPVPCLRPPRRPPPRPTGDETRCRQTGGLSRPHRPCPGTSPWSRAGPGVSPEEPSCLALLRGEFFRDETGTQGSGDKGALILVSSPEHLSALLARSAGKPPCPPQHQASSICAGARMAVPPGKAWRIRSWPHLPLNVEWALGTVQAGHLAILTLCRHSVAWSKLRGPTLPSTVQGSSCNESLSLMTPTSSL